jgi:hypothetical protein
MEKGSNSTVWYGVVEDRQDPLAKGRVKVRIFGYHSSSTEDIPKEDLVWSDVAVPAVFGINSGVGLSPTGVPEGTWVMGIWKDDGEGTQLPLVLFALPGHIPAETKENQGNGLDYLQQEIKKTTYVENYGDGFRDPRTEEELEKEPTNKFKKKEYPDGKGKKGDKRGAQIENDKAEKFPRKQSNDCINFVDGTMSDMSVLATNNEKYIDNTIVGYKRTSREKGGLLDDGVKIASIEMKPFKCGVTNESKANKGTNKKLGIGDNTLVCTWVSSTFENYAAKIEEPTNSNNEPVYKDPETSSSYKRYNSQQEFFAKASEQELQDYFEAKLFSEHSNWEDSRVEAEASRQAQQIIKNRK